MNNTLFKTLSFSLAVLLVGGMGIAHAQPALNPLTGYTGYTERYDIPYANSPGYGAASPSASTLNLEILGTSLEVTLDTGSRGLYVSQNMLPGNYTPTGVAGNLYLSSSKRVFQGTWADLEVKFPDATGVGGATGDAKATMPVLVVQSLTALGGNATYSTQISSGTIMLTDNTTVPIIGSTVILQPGQVATYAANAGKFGTASNFGVGIDPSGANTHPNNTDQYNQQYNAFLNLDQMKAGTMWAGYTLGQDGVHVGLTQSETGFAYTNLVPTGLAQVPGSPPDWQIPTGTIVYEGNLSATGRILVDVGIDYAFLTLPGTHSGNASANYTVNLLNSNGNVSFQVNGNVSNILNPAYTEWSDFNPGPFSESQSPYGEQYLNTGRDVINGFDILYDGTNGLYGMKTNSSVPSANITFNAGYYPTPVPAPVPEPATVILPALCGALLLGWRLRRRAPSVG